MANLKMYNPPEGKKSTFKLDPHSYYEALKDPFELKELESLNLIKAHLQEFKKCFVATSHGKDSLVMTHLVWRACQELKIPMIECWLNDTLNTFKEEKAFWELFNKWLGIEDKFRIFMPPKLPNGKQATVWSVAELYGHLPVFRTPRFLIKKHRQHGKNDYVGHTPKCCDWLKKKSINDFLKSLPKEERFDCHFVGTRAEESYIRRMGVLQRCRSYLAKTRKPYPMRTVTPLSFWTKADVYQYFEKWKMPRNPTYEIHNLQRLGCASCPAYKGWELVLARDPTNEAKGMLRQNLKILKRTEPDRYNEVINNLKKHHLMPELWNQTTLELTL